MSVTTILSAGGAVAGVKAIETVIEDVYKTSKGALLKRLRVWRNAKRISRLYENIAHVRRVKTIWQVDKEVDLLDFYHPAKVNSRSGEAREITTIDDLPESGNILLEGIVGQGKSIFLRYLCSQELYRGRAIPVFLEFRRIEATTPLIETLRTRLEVLGLDVTVDDVRSLADQGKLTLFLDAFDELPAALTRRVIHELEDLIDRFPRMRVIATTRPSTQLAHSSRLRVCRLSHLNNSDTLSVIRRLAAGEEYGERLAHALSASGGSIQGILTTPLMVTLLVITYRAYQRLPGRLSEFYENLFAILWSRHDDSKPGFNRAKRCQLNDREVRKVFDTLCFLTRREGLVELSRQKILQAARNAIDSLQYECDDAALVDDVRDITNLLLLDGDQYSFIHKSVAEFHAAAYIAGLRDDDRSEQVYKTLRERHWQTWQEELMFLKEIDSLRFNRYFFIPDCEAFFKKYLRRIPKTWNQTPKSVIQRLYKEHYLFFAVTESNSLQVSMVNTLDVEKIGWAFMTYASFDEEEPLMAAYDDESLVSTINLGIARRLTESFDGMDSAMEVGYKVNISRALSCGVMSYDPLSTYFGSVIYSMVSEYQMAVESLRHHERSKAMVIF